MDTSFAWKHYSRMRTARFCTSGWGGWVSGGYMLPPDTLLTRYPSSGHPTPPWILYPLDTVPLHNQPPDNLSASSLEGNGTRDTLPLEGTWDQRTLPSKGPGIRDQERTWHKWYPTLVPSAPSPMTDTRLWKHCLPATSVSGGNKKEQQKKLNSCCGNHPLLGL